jgi:hypothetical protein
MSLLRGTYVITREAPRSPPSSIPPGIDWKAHITGCIAHLEETQAWNNFAGTTAQTIRQMAIAALKEPWKSPETSDNE